MVEVKIDLYPVRDVNFGTLCASSFVIAEEIVPEIYLESTEENADQTSQWYYRPACELDVSLDKVNAPGPSLCQFLHGKGFQYSPCGSQ